MFKLTCNFDSKAWAEEAEKKVLAMVAERCKHEIQSLRCPEHGESPTLRVRGQAGGKLTTEIHACCQPMMDQAAYVEGLKDTA